MVDGLQIVETKIEIRLVTEYSWLCPKCAMVIKRGRKPTNSLTALCNPCRIQHQEEWELRKKEELRVDDYRLDRRWEIARDRQVLVSDIDLSDIKVVDLEFCNDTDISKLTAILPSGAVLELFNYQGDIRIAIDNSVCVSNYTIQDVCLSDKDKADIDRQVEEEFKLTLS